MTNGKDIDEMAESVKQPNLDTHISRGPTKYAAPVEQLRRLQYPAV